MREGYLYITCTKKLLEEAALSSRSLRKALPTAHITLFTNKLEDVPTNHEFNHIEIKSMKKQQNLMSGFHGKVQFISDSPYDKTLFLDSDTYICEDPSGAFKLLDYFDLLQVPAPGESLARDIEPPYNKIEGASMYNCGVLFFSKNYKTSNLFNIWKQFYFNQKPGKTWLKDKPRFREQHPYFQAFLRSECRIHALNSIWNFRVGSHLTLKGKVKIIHGRGIKRTSHRKFVKVPFTEAQYEALKNIVNITDESRLWDPRTKCIIRKGKSYEFKPI